MQFSWLSPSLLCALISTACVGNITQVSKRQQDLAFEDRHFYILTNIYPYIFTFYLATRMLKLTYGSVC